MSNALSQLGPSEIKVNRRWCKACGICIALCPKNVLGADEKGKAVVVAPENCTRCGICETHCPDFAISVEVNRSND